ncbi:feruloyl-CoA synthase [Pseudooceanicola algae]|uniref:2-succinylbenzoate--CoA ligase n=1 Tax=Pseudooceanicola algae TaxID=1537215 RepID=A0A418SKV7_9RHOB|nr:feruloyl-CoA synthase [Pseudooceanicola algae]QPM91019.1 2-succinylbenzoate--CoA ligase [Pseudooceanicola algae]
MRQATAAAPHSVAVLRRDDGALEIKSRNALGPVTGVTGDWLDHWASVAPQRVFLAERRGAGWREVTYGEARDRVRGLGAWLLAQGFGPGDIIACLSANSVDHGLLVLAAQYVGLVSTSVAEQYSLIPGAHDRLTHVIETARPVLVWVDDAVRYGEALALPALQGIPVLASDPGTSDATSVARAATHPPGPADAARARVTPDMLAKILFTSGSTAHPKAVMTTHRMMCVNQAQLAACFPVLRQKVHRIVDWLPWNHVFGGSHNFNMMLSGGGALYIDDGKPTDKLFARTIENLSMVTGTLSFNVPVGYARLLAAMQADAGLRARFFEDLDFLFYAGASLPQEVWTGLEDMGRAETGEAPWFISSWGMTETSPCTVVVHEKVSRSGIIGVPVPGAQIKLIPEDEGRYELRCKGPNIMPGYLGQAAKTAESFDAEGWLITGDAVRFVDPGDPDRGLAFDGRISEDFKLTSGTWVRVAALRGQVTTALNGLVVDLVITGHDRDALGVLLVPAGARGAAGEVLSDRALLDPIRDRLAALAAQSTGSSTRIARALVMAEPPSLAEGEMTAKGNINIRKLLTRRAALVERLYAGRDPAVIEL